MSYTPVEILLGPLPEFHEEEKVYDITGIPADKEILVYAFVTIKGEKGPFQRGYYEISTTDGANEYKQYMNVATGEGIAVLNSANVWLPIGDGRLKLKLVCADCKKGKKSIKGVAAEDGDWSSAFLIGYKG